MGAQVGVRAEIQRGGRPRTEKAAWMEEPAQGWGDPFWPELGGTDGRRPASSGWGSEREGAPQTGQKGRVRREPCRPLAPALSPGGRARHRVLPSRR